ncbi:MAG: chemotaxis response regulator protein-glutamate methylesterase [Phycisphaerae bacterium]|nr:chemotaxis response regulator protein-glutamate methylesterase [Phycisphaerae bacterium]
MATSNPLIRVLIVDDSALLRNLLTRVLSTHPQIEVVGTAVDGIDALQKIAALRPNVVTLDIEMPRLNGIGVLERAAGKVPVSFLLVSTLTQAGAQVTLEGLRKGAFDYITKPQSGAHAAKDFQRDVQRKVLAAARTNGRVRRILQSSEGSSAPKLPPNHVHGWVVGIGISCGGPQTLAEMLPAFPSDFVPILITQHMPAQFTGPFAQHLDQVSAMIVREAVHGDTLEQGTVYIAPGSHHLRLVRQGLKLRIALDPGPLVSGHRPSADVMFESMAGACAIRSVGVVMTGMGRDGARGLHRLHAAGAWTIAQDRETSLVYGMPKVAAELGAVDRVRPLGMIPGTIAAMLQRGQRPKDAAVQNERRRDSAASEATKPRL